ncbi:ABC transporter ATP-binding protein [Pueribacillus theae]|uniref:ABC transporter ATP-binding protein n=1 Tax=Pueribacillus theae TaxID=2171751 RepID=A0A2U1JJ08_9BACI|nr:ABC transporter ATP-binding protein [Pueribacillus theae]PWA04995.1 ABC transporter ATP-binding protein [Pueribacillus theae]
MSNEIIEIDQLTKKYDQTIAVDHLSLSIKRGEIFGLLGPNGAGKSTTILMLLGLSEPTSGTVKVCGFNSTKEPIAVKKRVGYLPDDLGFYESMTGLENLVYTAALNGIPKQEATDRALKLLERVGLADATHKKAGKYSRGMRQRLGLADVLIKNPDVIILDEPTLGIDPEGVRELLQLIKTLSKEEKITVLLSSHHLHQVQQICDRVGLFVNGKLLAVGEIHELATQLFLDKTTLIYVETSPISEELINQLKQIPSIIEVKQSNQRLEIYCNENVTSQIAETILKAGASLNHLSIKNYGLDEIYHRYFEGRGLNEGQYIDGQVKKNRFSVSPMERKG